MKTAFAVSIATLSLAACASGPQTAAPDNSRVTGMSDTHVYKTSDADLHEDLLVDAPRVKVLNALKAAYTELGIEMKYSNPVTGELGNLNFVKMHSIAGTPLSNYLNCGQTAMGLVANDYRVTMSMVSMVVAEGTGSRVQTRLQAHATDAGTSTEPRDCQSLGSLEARLHQIVKTKLTM